jgi:hypothetical protein
VVLLEDVAAQNKGEQQLVLLEEGAAHVAVQIVGKVVRQVTQAPVQNLGLVAKTRKKHPHKVYTIVSYETCCCD